MTTSLESPSADILGSRELAFDCGYAAGQAWAVRAATAEQVRELWGGSLDLADLVSGPLQTPTPAAFRSGFVQGVRDVAHHAKLFRDGGGEWPYADLQPDAQGVVLRLRSVLDEQHQHDLPSKGDHAPLDRIGGHSSGEAEVSGAAAAHAGGLEVTNAQDNCRERR
jgi:hypothetical protein